MHYHLKMIWIRVARRMISVMQIVVPISPVQTPTDSLVLRDVIETWLIARKVASLEAIAGGCLKDICAILILGPVQMLRIVGGRGHRAWIMMNMTKQRKIGLLFAVVHLIIFFWFLSYLNDLSGYDGQGPLLWVYWLVIDFPVSLLVILLFAVDVTSHYVMYIVHGILGTIWWFYVPTLFYRGLKKISVLKQQMH